MQKNIMRLLAALMAAFLLLPLALPARAAEGAAKPTSGTCGDGVTWSYSESSATLTIEGKGEMQDNFGNVIIVDEDDDRFGTYRAIIPEYYVWAQDTEHIVVKSGVTSIGQNAFYKDFFATNQEIDRLFDNAGYSYIFSNLKTVELADTVESIGKEAFYGTPELHGITLPTGLKSIGDRAFICSGLTSIKLPEGLVSVGKSAFSLTQITSAYVPSTVADIGDQAFNSSKLEEILVSSDNKAYKSVDGVLYKVNSENSWEIVDYPANRKSTSYIMPNQVTELRGLGYSSFFAGTNVTSITVGSGLKEITTAAFAFVDELSEIILPDGLVSIAADAFSRSAKLSKLFVPASVTDFSTYGYYYPSFETVRPDVKREIYFFGEKAPKFENNQTTLFGESWDIYYPTDAVGWDQVMAQEELAFAISNGTLTFHTWDPVADRQEAAITAMVPASGGAGVGYDAANPPVFKLEFDRTVASQPGREFAARVDMTIPGGFSIYRALDDKLIYQSSEYSDTEFRLDLEKSGVTLTPTNNHALLEPGTEYYITVSKGFILFTDGSTNPDIKKGDWTFTTAGTKPVEPEQPPIEPEQPPVEPEQPPVEPEQPPVEPERPVEPEQPPVEPERPSEKYEWKGFSDVSETSWYYGAVRTAYESGIMSGKSGSVFAPLDSATRAEAVVVLWKLAGEPEIEGEIQFLDVPEELWYSQAVRWAAATGITVGNDRNEFQPDRAINREQLTLMLMHYADIHGLDVSRGEGYKAFSDAASISDFALDAVAWAVEKGIIAGADNCLLPLKNASRAEMAAMIARLNSLD